MAKHGKCSVCGPEEREKTLVARGMCWKHYQEARKKERAQPATAFNPPIEGVRAEDVRGPLPSPVPTHEEMDSKVLQEGIGSLQSGINNLIGERNQLRERNKTLRKELMEAVGQLRELKTLVDGNLSEETS